MVPECPGCGLVFRRAPGQWLGSWFLNILVVQVVLVVVIPVAVALTWPGRLVVPAIVAIAVGVAVVVPLAVFPFTRTVWTAIDLIMRPLEFGEGVPPGVELDQIRSDQAPTGTHPLRRRKRFNGGSPPGQ
jgi:hypothetical protein